MIGRRWSLEMIPILGVCLLVAATWAAMFAVSCLASLFV